MEVNLRVTNRHGEHAVSFAFRAASGATVIGRARDSDIWLDDPERIISGRHALIEVRDGSVWITDTSRNGTFLNRSPSPLPTHQPTRLHDGDRLTIGSYDLCVGVEREPLVASVVAPEPLQTGLTDHPLLGMSADGTGTDILTLLGADGTAGEDSGFEQVGCASRHLTEDPFADAAPLDCLLEGAPEMPQPRADSHQTPVENVYFRAPEPQAIPEDYDILNDVWAAPVEVPGIDALDGSTPMTMPATASALAPAQIPDRPIASRLAHSPSDAVASDSRPDSPAVGLQAPSPLPAEAELVSGSALVNALLEGLGVGDSARVEHPEELMHNAGALLRELAAGLTLTMMGRSQFKSELRLGVTTIRPAENNLFKFSVDPGDTLDRLLFRKSPKFLPAVPAAREAFDDIRAHEMAMTAGLQAALRALLARFEPAELERRLSARSPLDQVLPMARKARYWDLFTEAYQDVASDAAEDFMHLFGDAFTKAYQDQIARLKQVRERPRD